MFSVVIPLYNKSGYIGKCLKSVFDQTFQDFEIIVVNDGSTDDSLEKVQNLAAVGVHPITIHCQTNAGVSTARNMGVKTAHFEFIAFLDADDWWEPTYLQEMKILIWKFPEAVIFGSNYFDVKNDIKKKAEIAVEQEFSSGLIDYCRVYANNLNMPLWTGATIIRKTIFELEKGFNPKLKLGEDFDLWIRIALNYPVAFLNKHLANYNQDVDLAGRAVGNLQKPDAHILWNLEYLADEELTNRDLKQLIDNLRIYDLFPYFLNKDYHELARKELNKVDWSKQPISAKLRYNMPLFVLMMIYKVQQQGSKMKQFFLRSLSKSKTRI